jgi:hypothetical protein
MKLFFLSLAFSICFPLFAFGQEFDTSKSLEPQIKEFLKGVKRDSSDKTCQHLMNDFYYCFESDSGQANPLMISASISLFKYRSDVHVANRQLAVLLYEYINSVEEPKQALIWIRALKKEYANIYGHTHPLIYLYEGESLINDGQITQAYTHFREFQKVYPTSIVALCYIYQTEPDDNLQRTWLSVLKATHPNHWIVKKYE